MHVENRDLERQWSKKMKLIEVHYYKSKWHVRRFICCDEEKEKEVLHAIEKDDHLQAQKCLNIVQLDYEPECPTNGYVKYEFDKTEKYLEAYRIKLIEQIAGLETTEVRSDEYEII